MTRMKGKERLVAASAEEIAALMGKEADLYREQNEAQYAFNRAESNYKGLLSEMDDLCETYDSLTDEGRMYSVLEIPKRKEVEARCKKLREERARKQALLRQQENTARDARE